MILKRLLFPGKRNMEKKHPSNVWIDETKQEIHIHLDKQCYPGKYIDSALQDFRELCLGRQDEENLILVPIGKSIELKKLGYEFCNYRLASMQNSGFMGIV